MTQPTVTAVVATFNRVPALLGALESVRQQTFRQWSVLVVGDCCTPETGDAIAGLNDERIRYVNLPERCREQALPNSVGMALADTKYIAFLNHDDFWLPDHLERAIAALEQKNADLYLGAAAFAINAKAPDTDFTISEITPAARDLKEAYWRPFYYLEPISSWVIRRTAAETIGPMTPASLSYRTPVEDWALRAWRSGIEVLASDDIAVVKDNTTPTIHQEGGTYQAPKVAVTPLLERSRHVSADELRHELIAMHKRAVEAGHTPRDFLTPSFPEPDRFRAQITPEAGEQFFASGEDAYDHLCESIGLERGWVIRNAVQSRVAETLAAPPDLTSLIGAARSALTSAA